jgi:hypothetical protein
MSSRVGQCWRLAGETLRICSDQTAGPKRAISSTWHSPITRRPEGNSSSGPDMIMPRLPSGRRVIAPREVEEVAHTRSLPGRSTRSLALVCMSTISETCPPGKALFGVNADGVSRRRSRAIPSVGTRFPAPSEVTIR